MWFIHIAATVLIEDHSDAEVIATTTSDADWPTVLQEVSLIIKQYTDDQSLVHMLISIQWAGDGSDDGHTIVTP